MRIIAAILFLISLPFILLGAISIALFALDAPLFLQERIGLDRQPFTIVKLRSMKKGKVTRIGKLLRGTGIDELPQLWNVIIGDMSLVGPRPLTQFDIDRLEWNTEQHAIRWSVKPGITGLAQFVNVCDKSASWNADLEYLRRKSVRLDLQILFFSFLVPLLGKKKGKELISYQHESTH